ncbi:hypothetical protein CONPUDRAFT_154695 [Coniophora puteana RWD-64-598 SS2]|uniref:Uncharacterized protein n=1 Tax=Coniophora puteana (strain RWD-64-598) TaxID=741705 RepID=A0A5M3MQ44_CONPW|nr:uncharacterized protein CONPUDRAFT_154695 [Coniophora puteana RWD-64-598 SS2]EIW80681.1 hypothetical protein CONPUDRAFT_154695 [Coniophora puteana RWD-64-598 SS2]
MSALDKCEELGKYMQALHVGDSAHVPTAPSWLSASLCSDVQRAMEVIAAADNCLVLLQGDAEYHTTHLGPHQRGTDPNKESVLEYLKPHLTYPEGRCPWSSTDPDPITKRLWATEPFKLADALGRVILWFLPALLSPERQDRIVADIENIAEVLSRGMNKAQADAVPATVKQWRRSKFLFNTQLSLSRDNITGSMDISPGWYAQGHETPAAS